MNTPLIKTCLSSSIERYVELKRALGREYCAEYRVLQRLNSKVSGNPVLELMSMSV